MALDVHGRDYWVYLSYNAHGFALVCCLGILQVTLRK